MQLQREYIYRSEDYWNLLSGQWVKLLDGRVYNMALPGCVHQELVIKLLIALLNHISSHYDECKVYLVSFAVNLTAYDKTWVEPNISIICDRSKLSDRGCEGAPDWIIEIVSSGSVWLDYSLKLLKY